MRRIAALLVVVTFAVPSVAFSQPAGQSGDQVAPAQPRQESPESSSNFDPTKMGVSLDRIKRELIQAEIDEKRDGVLNLRFTVEVVGQAPKINLLEGFAFDGPLPYGSPTHQEVLDVLTPKEFRSPVIPFSAAAVWAAQWLQQKSKKQRCEEELAEYRRLVMAGVPIAAPRCAQ